MAEAEDSMSVVTEECLQELLDFFLKSAYKARNVDRRYEVIHKHCIHLVGKDYKIDVIDNKLGQLCAHYPSELIVIQRELEEGEIRPSSKKVQINNVSELRELIPAARLARCRSRFVMPVILYENKNICRSSTLSSMAELYGRSGFDWILTLPTIGIDMDDQGHSSQGRSSAEERTSADDKEQSSTDAPVSNGQAEPTSSESDWVLLHKIRGHDVQLLKALGVELICDLMVEKKKLKYGLYVCSSEKVDKWARYSDFSIASMPYPGCEFFKDYKDNGYNAVSLKFDWSQAFVDAELNVPLGFEDAIDTPSKNYQEWDLVEITRNYMKMLLYYLTECDGGILVHCISGWDRTPLYITLLRLSLWADGKIHRSLCAAEMLYLTLAYDWLIYGHQFKERHEKGEEVLYFCFDFLKYITSEDFSVLNRNYKPARLPRTTTPMSATGSEGRSRKRDILDFDIHPTQHHESSYELGESWVGVESGSYHTSSSSLRDPGAADALSDSSSNPPEHRSMAAESWQQVECLNHLSRSRSSSPVMSLSSSSQRAPKLNKVRELFLKVFRTSIPETAENTSAGTLAGLTGFFSKLASTVIN